MPSPATLRFALRSLAKTPTATTAAILSLTLAIGANTAVFSFVDALLLRTLPVPDPRQLVAIRTTLPAAPDTRDPLPVALFDSLASTGLFTATFAWTEGGMVTYRANAASYAASVSLVAGDFFHALGAQPALGRLLQPADTALHNGVSAPVAVLDYRAWRQLYHADPAVLGQDLFIDGHRVTIVGVAPESFTGLLIDSAPDAYAPLGYSGSTRFHDPAAFSLEAYGRLRPGVTIEQARARLAALWPALRERSLPAALDAAGRARFRDVLVTLDPAGTGSSYLRGRLRRPLLLLMGSVALLMLIACANLANLMLARTSARARELGLRAALGAGRWSLLQSLLAETLLLSTAGGLLGYALAFPATRFLIGLVYFGYAPLQVDTRPGLPVAVFTFALALGSGLLLGLAPLRRVLRADPATVLRRRSHAIRGPGGRSGRLLVAGQVALSLVLVTAAALLAQSLQRLRALDLGYRPDHVLTMQLFAQQGTAIENRAAYYRTLAANLAALPGVDQVSFSSQGPVTASEYRQSVSIASTQTEATQAAVDSVGPAFFDLMGMRLLAGREFRWSDDETSPPVAIVSQSLARRLFGPQTAVGKIVGLPGRPRLEVVGVVNSASLWNPRSREPLAVYTPLMQEPTRATPLADIRYQGEAQAVARAAEGVLAATGRQFSLRTQTLDARMDRVLTNDRLLAMLAAFFGGAALLLASLGLYGVISHGVAQRTVEIGVRVALGARRSEVLGMVLCEAGAMALAGIAVGVPLALAAARMLSTVLFGISAQDPGALAASAAVLLAVALLAGFLPARRAAHIDPMTALREE